MTFFSSDFDFEDEMRSWWCGKNLSYNFCKIADDDCAFENGLSGAGNIQNGQLDAESQDTVSRIELRKYDPLEQGAITVFTEENCKGVSGRFLSYKHTDSSKEYSLNEL